MLAREMFRNLNGFSLIEIMIAMVLGIFLISVLIEFYSVVKSTYQTEVSLAHLQEDARNASMILIRNIEMAGYSGCRHYNLFPTLKGFSNAHLPRYLVKKVKEDSDVIEINKADTKITTLTQDAKAGSNFIKTQANPAINTEPQMLISDCENAELITARNFSGTTIMLNGPLKYHYNKKDSQVARFNKIDYFIGKTSRKNSKGSDLYALYAITNQGKKEELVENVSDMRILCGTVANNKVNNYESVNQVKNWSRVKSLLINLTFVTADNKSFSWPLYIGLENGE